MRLWKRGPATFAGLAFVTLLASIAFEPVPILGFVAANLIAPLIATGMLYASLAADRGEGPRLKHAIAPFAAPAGAQVAVVAAGIVAFAAEAISAWQLADVNLFLPAREAMNLPMRVVMAIYVAGMVASLPLTFVPFAALFDGEGVRAAFATSVQAFTRNVPRWSSTRNLAAAAAIGLATMGIACAGVALDGRSFVRGMKDISG
jgi:hypothetical protein